MKHAMLDIYGVNIKANGLTTVNEIINKTISQLGLKAIMPTLNFPYFYSEPIDDGGISSFCLLDGGHITLHTFPFFNICYADILFDDFDEGKVETVFGDLLKPKRIDFWCFDRDAEKIGRGYTPETDFGPHLLVSAVSDKKFGVGEVYSILESLPAKIGMHPISRPIVATNRIADYDVISGMIIIAESHISFHANLKTGKVYFDIYSCKFCDREVLYTAVKEIFGEDITYQLISRGEKHKNALKPGYSLSDNGWRSNI